MIRKILVPLDPSAYSETALEFACRIAKIYDAEITGLVVLDIPGIEASIGPLPAGGSFYAKGLSETKIEAAKVHINNLLGKFKAYCQEKGVRHVEADSQGRPSAAILKQSAFFDAVVIGMETYFHFETTDEAGESFEELLDHCITPIFTVPEKLPENYYSDDPLRVVIALDGSQPSIRAIQRFARLETSKETTVKIVASLTDQEYGERLLKEAADYLEVHGYKNVKYSVYKEHIIKIFSDELLANTDLIVLGAHSSMGLLDFIVGSLTKHLLRQKSVPMFIGQ